MTTAKRRGRGDGNIRTRADGRWEGSVEVTVYGTGRRRKYVYGRTRIEVTEKLREVQQDIDEGLPLIDERVTVARFLQTWLDQVVKPARGYATWQGYEVNVRRHIVPLLGTRTLAKLSPADIQALINIKREEGLAPRTVQYVHATIRAALGVAMRWGVVARNVATLVEPVSVTRAPVLPFSPEEVDAMLDAASEGRLGAFYTVALAIGLRPSEALGLKWADIDFSEGGAGEASLGAPRGHVDVQGTQVTDEPADHHLAPGVRRNSSSPTGTANCSSGVAPRPGKPMTSSSARPPGRRWTAARSPGSSPSSKRGRVSSTTACTTVGTRRPASSWPKGSHREWSWRSSAILRTRSRWRPTRT